MNVFIASGNLGRDIDIRVTPGGKTVGSFPLPVRQGYGDYEKTSWVDCKLLGDRANKLSQYLVKGKKVTVQGEFVLEQWEKDGVKNSKPVIIVNDIDMHGGSQQQTSPAPKQQAQSGSFDNFNNEEPPF